MVATYSYKPDDANDAAFHDETNRAIKLLRQASDRLGRNPNDDLGTSQRKRKQRAVIDQAIKAVEKAQRKGIDAESRTLEEYPVLTKFTLHDAVKSLGSLDKVATFFGMSTGSIKRSMRMFNVEPDSYDDFFSKSSST